MSESYFLIKLQTSGLQLYSKRDWHRHFPVDFAKIFKNTFFTEHLQWLLLILTHLRSSRLEVFYKKGVRRNFAKFTEKHLR